MALEQSARKVVTFIREHWDDTVRTPEDQGEDEVKLPRRFTCPDPKPPFRGFYYWDTYYTSVGLWLTGRDELVADDAENMLFLLEKLGYVPNYADKKQLNRSQPPHASMLMRGVYERSKDKEWLKRAYEMLVKEYAFWNSLRLTSCGLNGYHHHATPDDIYSFAGNIRERKHPVPDNPVPKMRYLSHIIAEAESGWDYTPRFDHRCADFAPIDLNALLYGHERDCEYFAKELGKAEDAGLWSKRAETHREIIENLCWSEEDGYFYDHDVPNERAWPLRSPAAFYALWRRVATEEQAARVVENLPALERECGLTTCPRQDPAGDRPGVYQWDDPNAWAPLHHAAIEGLLAFGYQREAERIAGKWVSAVTNSFEATGQLWEKYNAYDGSLDVTNEYPLKPMLGWTAGVFLNACRVLGML